MFSFVFYYLLYEFVVQEKKIFTYLLTYLL